jgi:hypothetical protein
MLDKIKNKKLDENVNKEIDMVYNLISYNDWLERIKHYDEILPIYTVILEQHIQIQKIHIKLNIINGHQLNIK